MTESRFAMTGGSARVVMLEGSRHIAMFSTPSETFRPV